MRANYCKITVTFMFRGYNLPKTNVVKRGQTLGQRSEVQFIASSVELSIFLGVHGELLPRVHPCM